MPEYTIILLGGLLVVFVSIILDLLDENSQEELFIQNIVWQGQIIKLGDPITINTPFIKDLKGYFRGVVAGKYQWTLRFSSDDNPWMEINWHEITDIKKDRDVN